MAKATAKKARSKDKIDRRTGVQEAIEMGITAIRQGDRKQAHSIFQQTAELHPNISEVWMWLGGTSPNLEDAESAFEKAYTIDPDNEQASLGLRWVRLRRKVSLADIVDATVAVPTAPVEISTPDSTLDVPATITCANCEAANARDERFCVQCGQDLSAMVSQDAQTPNTNEESKQGMSGRTVVFAAMVIIAVAIALMAFVVLNHPLG